MFFGFVFFMHKKLVSAADEVLPVNVGGDNIFRVSAEELVLFTLSLNRYQLWFISKNMTKILQTKLVTLTQF